MFIRKISFLIFCIFLLFGCQQAADESLGANRTNTDERYYNVTQTNTADKELTTNTEIAEHLANLAAGVPSVNNASALVAGPYAVVAIDLDKDMERERVGTIKYSVSEALYHDPYGKTAVVIADADLTQRLNNMGNKIGQGYPVQGVVDELAAIVARYMPEFPVRHDQPAEPDKNKQIISDEENDELNKIQKEQSTDSEP